MDAIETVEEHCSHKDCVYRCTLHSLGTDFCSYILAEGEPRGCDISACNKYRKGRRKVVMTRSGIWFHKIEEEEFKDDGI